MAQWQGTDSGEADAEGKVTNYGDVFLTESLHTARTIQSHFCTLDAFIDDSQLPVR